MRARRAPDDVADVGDRVDHRDHTSAHTEDRRQIEHACKEALAGAAPVSVRTQRLGGQRQPERAAATGRGLDPDVPAVQLDDLAAHGQAQPGPGARRRPGRGRRARRSARGCARSRPGRCRPRSASIRGGCGRAQRHDGRRVAAELQRVGQQVLEHARQLALDAAARWAAGRPRRARRPPRSAAPGCRAGPRSAGAGRRVAPGAPRPTRARSSRPSTSRRPWAAAARRWVMISSRWLSTPRSSSAVSWVMAISGSRRSWAAMSAKRSSSACERRSSASSRLRAVMSCTTAEAPTTSPAPVAQRRGREHDVEQAAVLAHPLGLDALDALPARTRRSARSGSRSRRRAPACARTGRRSRRARSRAGAPRRGSSA